MLIHDMDIEYAFKSIVKTKIRKNDTVEIYLKKTNFMNLRVYDDRASNINDQYFNHDYTLENDYVYELFELINVLEFNDIKYKIILPNIDHGKLTRLGKNINEKYLHGL